MSRWVGVDGYAVEVVRLNGRPRLRVTQYGFVVTYARSVAELARLLDLADLVEVASLADHRKSPSPGG